MVVRTCETCKKDFKGKCRMKSGEEMLNECNE